mgnify:CR=1 FL=1
MNQAIVESKKAVVAEIAQHLTESQSTVIVEYRGLTVQEITELRRALRAEDVEMKVYKNKLLLRALNELGKTGCDELLTGTTAVAFNYNDEVAPAKAVAEAMKDNSNLVFKFGYLNGEFVDASYVTKLSQIPSKEVLIAQLLTMLQAPVRGLACTLKAIAEK